MLCVSVFCCLVESMKCLFQRIGKGKFRFNYTEVEREVINSIKRQ